MQRGKGVRNPLGRHLRVGKHHGRAWIQLGAIAAALVFGNYQPANAQFDSAVQRTQSRVLQRAVTRNLERVFRPRLVISQGATGPVTALALSRDERYLMTAVGNNSVRLWDLSVGREVARLDGHQARVTDVALSGDGTRALSVSQDGSVMAWSLKGETAGTPLLTLPAAATAVVMAVDGKTAALASADGHVRVISSQNGAVNFDLAAHGAGLVRLAISADGQRLVTAGEDRMARLWDLKNGQKLTEWETDSAALSVALTGKDHIVAIGGNDGKVRTWRLSDDQASVLAKADPDVDRALSVATTADGQTLVVGAADGSVVALAADGSGSPRLLGKHDDRVSYVAVSKDGSFALSGSEDGSARLWSLASGAPLLTLYSTVNGWAVVDPKGRYDGNEQALKGIDWQGEDATANIEDLAETHYQSALLVRTLEQDPIDDAKSVPDGVRYPPSVRFISPEASREGGATTRSVTVELQATDNGGGVDEVRLYRNGKLVPANDAEISRSEGEAGQQVTARYRVDLGTGENILSATAVNGERLESRPQVLSLGEGTRPVGKLHILAVGVNRYADSKLNLNYATPDAKALEKVLNSRQSAQPVAQVTTLYDDQATRPAVLAALRALHSVPAEDVVVVYMAGHGVSFGDQWYYITHEVKIPSRPDQLAGQGLSSEELKAEMEALPAERTLLLLDTCHSGSAVSPLKDYRGLKSLRLMAKSVGTHVLAATDRNQFAVELDKLGHGIFTYALLQAMKGGADKNADSVVSATELIHYVEEAVPDLSRQYANYPQYPTSYSRGSDFAVTR